MILAGFLLISGCSAGLKERWGDFNAYFNTYYNAQESFKRGLKLMDNQVVTFNTARPIRVHLTPVRAGQADFEKAIEKSANVLREHKDSRWADDAIELIGKSYFYLGQYFSAEQKFDEVLMASRSDELRQRAVLWRGRIYLETNRFAEGADYLSARLSSEEFVWDPEVRGEIDLVLAQLYVEMENYASADIHLRRGIPNVKNRNLTARARFLHGQVLNLMDQPDAAFKAFSSVDRSYRDYQLIYHSEVEKGRIFRTTGNYDQALRHFQMMARDDKHFQEIGDLNYEIARTLHDRGEYEAARSQYKDVLYSSLQPPTRVTTSLSHYGLAELNRFVFGEYALAAAYYDSSAKAIQNIDLMPIGFDASALAKSFGDHTRLSRESFRLDSLLHLAMLPRATRDSIVIALRESRYIAYEARQRELLRQGTTLVSTRPGSDQGGSQNQGNSGFLNHKNPALVIQGSESFNAVWQKRPLVDNWRRMEVARNARVETAANASVERTGTTVVRNRTDLDGVLNINLYDLPLTAEKQLATKQRIAALQYEIGNVFYLSLNMPDSALNHYRVVTSLYPETDVAAQALYSIADVALSASDSTQAYAMARRLRAEHPGTVFETRLSQRIGWPTGITESNSTASDSLTTAYHALIHTLQDQPPTRRAESLRAFSLSNREFARSGDLLYASARAYAEAGRSTATYLRLAAMPDSIAPFRYVGAEWDSTRAVLNSFLTLYPQHPSVSRARILISDLTPKEPQVVKDIQIIECKLLDQPLTVKGGMDAFVQSSGLKRLMERVGVVEADFEFEVIVSETGAILDIQPITEADEFGFLTLLVDRMKTGLNYFPPMSAGTAVRSRCDIVVSVRP